MDTQPESHQPESEATEVSVSNNPFQSIHIRGLLGWMILGFILLMIVGATFSGSGPIARSAHESLFLLGLTLWPLIWMKWQLDIRRLKLKDFVGPLPEHAAWGTWMVVSFSLIVLGIGSIYLVWYPISLVAPSFIDSFLLSLSTFFFDDGTPRPLLAVALMIATGAIVAPIVEEILFRGFILHRWTHKWGLVPAILVSSVGFGLLHADPIGATVFGVVMCLLYIRSRSLWPPIICHALHNGAIYFMESAYFLAGMPKPTVEDFQSDLWVGIVALVAGLSWSGYYLIKNWPDRTTTLPAYPPNAKTTDEHNSNAP